MKELKRNAEGLFVLNWDRRWKLEAGLIKEDKDEHEDIVVVQIKDFVLETGTEHGVIRNVGRDLSHSNDGLNRVERRALFTCFVEGFTPNKPHTKLADILGRAMSDWYPHGDGAMLKTMWRIGRTSSAMIPYIDKKGSYGNAVSRSGGAARYIGGRLSKYAYDCFFSDFNIRNPIVDMEDNYKFSAKEPSYLPTKYPNWGAQWSTGIGVGASMTIAAFNFAELCEAHIKLIDDPKAKINIKPDTPNDTIITNKSELNGCFDAYKFRIKIRGRSHFHTVKDKYGDKYYITFTSIPHNVDVDGIKEAMITLLGQKEKQEAANPQAKRFKEIKDIHVTPVGDEGLEFMIEYEKGYDPNVLLAKLCKTFSFQTSITANFSLIYDNNPIEFTPRELALHWIETRIDQKYRFIVQKMQTLLMDKLAAEAFIKAATIDPTLVNQIAARSKNDIEFVKSLMKELTISELEARVLAATKVKDYTKENIQKKKDDIKRYQTEYKELTNILSKDNGIKELIKEELREGIRKYGKPRRAELIDDDREVFVAEEEKVAAIGKNSMVVAENYATLAISYNTLDNSFKTIKFKNKDTLLLTNEDGFMKQLDGVSFSINKEHVGLATLGASRNVSVHSLAGNYKYACIITEQGYGKIMELEECLRSTRTKCINLTNNDKIADVVLLTNLKGYLALMSDDRMYYIPINTLPVQKRGAAGNKLLKDSTDKIIKATTFSDDAAYIWMYGSNGYTKCIQKSYLHFNKKIDNYITFNGKVLFDILPLNHAGTIQFINEVGEDIRNYHVDGKNLVITAEETDPIKIKITSSIASPEKAFGNAKFNLFKINHL